MNMFEGHIIPTCPPGTTSAPLTRRALSAGILALALTGCSPGRNIPQVLPYNGTIYRLDAGDEVRIIIYGEQQLSQTFHIGDGGDLAFPLLGNLHAVGLTTTDLAAQIADEMRKRKLFRDPSVAVEVANYRPISMLGEVTKPGQFPYQPGMTLLSAIAVAGGFTYRAVQDYAFVVRQAGPQTVSGTITPQDYVQPGDVIKVYERLF